LSIPAEPVEEAPYFRRGSALDTVSCDIGFGAPRTSDSQVHQLNPKLFESVFSCAGISSSGEAVRSVHSVHLTSKSQMGESTDATQGTPRPTPWTFDYNIEFDPSSLEELRDELSAATPVGCSLQHFVPHWIIATFDEKTEIIRALGRPLVDPLRSRLVSRHLNTDLIAIPQEIITFLNDKRAAMGRSENIFVDPQSGAASLTDVLRWIRGYRLKQKAKSTEIVKELAELAVKVLPEKQNLTTIEMPPIFRDAFEYLMFFFSRSVRYLGPLREEPRPMYPLQNTSDPQDIGLHGEHTAAVFHNFRHTEIKYLPSSAFGASTISAEPQTASLGDAVFDWLSYLDVALRVETRDEGKFGHALSVYLNSRVSHDLTHVGVGVSQILPIVVMCLLANRETTLILEQPELHLNPKVQTRLGDFFLSMSLLNKQCLIETHSEYLINRLRFRAAAAPNDSLSKLMSLYFVEKQDGVSVYRDVVINEFGAIVDWPKGFFDQSQREVEDILLAATRKAKSEVSK